MASGQMFLFHPVLCISEKESRFSEQKWFFDTSNPLKEMGFLAALGCLPWSSRCSLATEVRIDPHTSGGCQHRHYLGSHRIPSPEVLFSLCLPDQGRRRACGTDFFLSGSRISSDDVFSLAIKSSSMSLFASSEERVSVVP